MELNLSLKKLWDINSPEEHFGNLFFNTAMSALENQQNFASNASTKPIQDSIFRIMGCAVENFPTNVSPCSQLVRMLQTAQWTSEEKLAKTVASLIEHVVETHDSKALLHDIMTEIGGLDGRDLNRDSKGTKVLSIFLPELANKLPHEMLRKMSLIVDHLKQDVCAVVVIVVLSFIFASCVFKMFSLLLLFVFLTFFLFYFSFRFATEQKM